MGETELAYRQAMPGLRAGDFFPNELGERLMPIIDGMSPALFALYDVEKETLRVNPNVRKIDGWPAPVFGTTEYADVMSIADELESLRLELRDANGVVVEAEHLWIRDTHRLLAQSAAAEEEDWDDEDLSEEMRAAIEHDVQIMLEHFEELENQKPWEQDDDRPWERRAAADDNGEEREYPRYQIFVQLAGYEPFGGSGYPSD